MEFNGFVLLAVLWFLVNLLTSGRKKPQPPARLPQPRPAEPDSSEPQTVLVPVDATQQEGSRLEAMLRDLQRNLEEAQQYHTSLPPTHQEDIEETASLEMEPEIVSLEHEVNREARVRVDRDDEAGEFETRRIEAAAVRDGSRSEAKQAPAAEKIRREVSDHTATRAYTPEQLRHAVVWREILGPPVGLRVGEAGRGGSGEG